MVDDSELADATYGILKWEPKLSEYQVVRDWRVAGALMEKALKEVPDGDIYSGWCSVKEYWVTNDDYSNDSTIFTGGNLPRTLILSWVEALSSARAIKEET